MFNVYKYPYFYFTFGILSYNFNTNNNNILHWPKKQKNQYYKSKTVLYNKQHNIKDLKNNKKQKQKTNRCRKRINNQWRNDKSSRPFIRINTKSFFPWKNKRLPPGTHVFKDKDFGAMVIYPGYESTTII